MLVLFKGIMQHNFVKIVVFVPVSHADAVREALAEAGAGHIGNYDSCSFSSRGTGRFRGMQGSKPFIGERGTLEEVSEERIETLCPADNMGAIMEAVREAHPYEEPAIDIYPLLNEK